MTLISPARYLFLALTLSAASAQPPAVLDFEVASVKPSGPASKRSFDGGPGSANPTRYIANFATLQDFIARAYNVAFFQLSSKIPLDQDHFDLAVNLPPGTTDEQFRIMFQRLLAERFHLKLRIESKEFAGYELTVAKSGLKLQESLPDAPALLIPEGFPVLPPNIATWTARNSRVDGYVVVRVTARQQPLATLALSAVSSTPNREPIIDKTNLTGKYDFLLEYTVDLPGVTPASPPPAPSLFTALQQQLGLELVSKRIPFDYLIVESVARVPSGN